jgi:mono/diheme cytochrome c family protein
MPLVRRLARIAVPFAFVAVPALVLADAKPPQKGDPVRGKAVYSRTCILCHFADGSGGKKLTPNGNPSRDFRDPAFWASRTDDQLRATINNGVPKSGMIAWKGLLKPQEIEDVMAYEKLFPEKAKAAKAGPDAKPAPGAPAATPK